MFPWQSGRQEPCSPLLPSLPSFCSTKSLLIWMFSMSARAEMLSHCLCFRSHPGWCQRDGRKACCMQQTADARAIWRHKALSSSPWQSKKRTCALGTDYFLNRTNDYFCRSQMTLLRMIWALFLLDKPLTSVGKMISKWIQRNWGYKNPQKDF